MDFLDYLLEGLIAIAVVAVIGWAIANMAQKAARTILCAGALITITLILYGAFSLGVSSIITAANFGIGSIDAESGGKFSQIVGAVMPDNLVTCMSIVFSTMVSRLIYDWNVDFIKQVCS